MKAGPIRYAKIVSCALASWMIAGCAQKAAYKPVPRVYGPTHAVYMQNGIVYKEGSMAYPTGQQESSGLLVEKVVPAEVLAGKPFHYLYKVSNLTDHNIEMVTLSERVPVNFNSSAAEPKPTETRDGVATWQLGTIQPSETKVIHITGTSPEEGSVNTCGWASYSPVLCEDIRVLQAKLQLTREAPAQTLICDLIPMSITVKNIGSSPLTGVQVNEPLPEGLTSEGKNNLTFEVGNLAPGESREFKFNARAAKPGQYANKSQATCAQEIQAEAVSSTTVEEPTLEVSLKAPAEGYTGRPFDINLTVSNPSDTTAAGTVLELPIPAGLLFKSASESGQASEGKVTWNLGPLGAKASQQVSASFVSSGGGTYQFAPVARGECAKLVAASGQTTIMGVVGILLEKADTLDPVGVDDTTTYTVKVTNQGTAEDNNVRVVVTIAPELVPVSATGEGSIQGQTVTFPVVPRLAPKEIVSYQITVKGTKAGDGHTVFHLTSDKLNGPVVAEESTHVY